MRFTEERLIELFMEYLPVDVKISFQDARSYVIDALGNPFVQLQVRVGIYDLGNVWTEFMGAAKSCVLLNEVVICPELLDNHLEGMTPELAEAYVRCIAAHEAHHFEHQHIYTTDMVEQAHREKDCNMLIAKRYPHLDKMREQAEAQSVVIQRVQQRVAQLRKAS